MTMISGPNSGMASQYAYQIIFGLGVGLSFSAATIMTNVLASEPNERASAQGAVAQARVLGGCLGISICTVIFNIHVNKYLKGELTQSQMGALHRTPLSSLHFPSDQRNLIRGVYAGAFAAEIKVMAAICGVMVLASLFTLEQKPLPLERFTGQAKEESASRRGSESGTEMNDLASVQHRV